MPQEEMIRTISTLFARSKLCKVSANQSVREPDSQEPESNDCRVVEQRSSSDITGVELDRKEVRRARLAQIGHTRKKNVWTTLPRSEVLRCTCKLVNTVDRHYHRNA